MKSFAAAALLLATLIGSAQAQTQTQTPLAQAAPPAGLARLDMGVLSFAGANRYLGLYVPHSYQAGRPAPVIFALHGRFSSSQAMHAMSHLAAVAEQRGAILAYPDTVGHRSAPGAAVSDDGDFIAAALAAMDHDYAIDHGHIYLVGYDTGGGVAYDLACRGNSHFAGVAIVSALELNTAHATCAAANRPVSTLVVHGERDLYYPARGFTPQLRHPGVTAMSAEDTIADFRRINGCGGPTETGAGGSQYFGHCSSGAAVAYVSVPGGEHDWFHAGPRYALNQQGVDATTLIDQFFFARDSFTLPHAQSTPIRSRSYIVFAPPNYNPAQPIPIVLVLHGAPSNAASMAALSQMNAVATRHRFIAVYPDGLNGGWNAFFGIPEVEGSGPQDDIGFLKKLTEDLSVDFNIDRRRMYVAGLSNGGFMSIRMACLAGDYFAAFASVAAELYTQLSSRCPGPPAPIILIHGDADPVIPFSGITHGQTSYIGSLDSAPMSGGMGMDMGGMGMGMGRGGGMSGSPNFSRPGVINSGPLTMSAPDTANFFMNRNHCGQERTTTDIPASGLSPQTHVTRIAAQGCPDNDDVVFYRIVGGGHVWPGIPGILNPSFGQVTQDINAGEEIWTFFASHPLAHDPR